MIAYLAGTLGTTGADWLILVVGGVGFRVQCSSRTLASVTAIAGRGDSVMLHTEMLVREDAISLVGFQDEAERDWFDALRAIQGVGAKVALAVLSALSPSELVHAVATGDAAMVARANGVGPKLAARVVNELKGRSPVTGDSGMARAPALAASVSTDAVAALTGLGFRPVEAQRAVAEAEAELGAAAALDALIAAALRRSAR